MDLEHIVHSIPPTFDTRSRVLVLGSIPSPKSREVQYNYGHPQNRFWRVLAALADEPVPTTTERRRDFCLRHHIALWDVLAECDIDGASDSSIRNPVANDLARITGAAPIEAVFCTGAKAFELYNRLGCEQMTGLPAVKLPSTSPANAACNLERLCKTYVKVFEHTHEFEPPVLDVARVIQLEQQIAGDGTSLAELMDRAGTALARRIEIVFAERQVGSSTGAHSHDAAGNCHAVTFLCGSGNNGGDGWVAAEALARKGMPINVVSLRAPDEIRAKPAHDAAVRSLETLEKSGANILVDAELECIENALASSLVIVDCILGTGFDAKAVKEPYSSWIELANATADAAKLACDVPSGVSAQNGSSPIDIHARFTADETLTMIAPKPGLSSPECGTVRVAPLAYIEPYLCKS